MAIAGKASAHEAQWHSRCMPDSAAEAKSPMAECEQGSGYSNSRQARITVGKQKRLKAGGDSGIMKQLVPLVGSAQHVRSPRRSTTRQQKPGDLGVLEGWGSAKNVSLAG